MFLHSTQWREFQERVGRTTYPLGGDAYAVKMGVHFGKHYLSSPFFVPTELVEKAKQTGALFVKCEPMEQGVDTQQKLEGAGFSKSSKPLQPQKTIIVDIADEQEMLARMKQKTRYNIRLARKKGVVVQQEHSVDNFMALMRETTERDHFSAHPKSYYSEMIRTQGVSLYTAFVNNNPAATAIIIEHNKEGVYLHGASAYAYRAYMSPFALHWHIMSMFAQKGVERYDLWGIDENKWPGVTHFKRGFGGREVSYVGSYDYPIKKMWYMIYTLKQRA